MTRFCTAPNPTIAIFGILLSYFGEFSGIFQNSLTSVTSRKNRVYRKRNSDKTKDVIDVLVTQHAKWIASRLRRPLFGRLTASALASTSRGPEQLTKLAQKPNATNSRAQNVAVRTHNNCGQMRRPKAVFSNSEEATKVGCNILQNGDVSPPSPRYTEVLNF